MNPQPTRRPLGAALQKSSLSPAAIAIIKEGIQQPQVATVLAPAQEKANEEMPPLNEAASAQPMQAQESPRTRQPKEKPVEPAALICISVRIPARIPEALLKAASDRKIKRIQPYSQKDIVTEALQQWLQRNGYLPKAG